METRSHRVFHLTAGVKRYTANCAGGPFNSRVLEEMDTDGLLGGAKWL